ncbi:MAG: hypothetical protein JWL72_1542 [Ilumatobacteraceae bacterium]|nr:hypothetical protein [Ilumatobacteraceae bacterium]
MGAMTWRTALTAACGATLTLAACGSSGVKPLATSAPTIAATTTAVPTTAASTTALAGTTIPPSEAPTSAELPATIATQPATTTSPASTPPTEAASTSTATAGATIVATGYINDTLTQVPLTTGKCHGVGTSTSAGFEFDGSNGDAYVLQITLPTGTTTFPASPNLESVSFSHFRDESLLWTAGDQTSTPTAAGTATFDGAMGTIDLDLVPRYVSPAPPATNPPPDPALAPIHLNGSFVC